MNSLKAENFLQLLLEEDRAIQSIRGIWQEEVSLLLRWKDLRMSLMFLELPTTDSWQEDWNFIYSYNHRELKVANKLNEIGSSFFSRGSREEVRVTLIGELHLASPNFWPTEVWDYNGCCFKPLTLCSCPTVIEN